MVSDTNSSHQFVTSAGIALCMEKAAEFALYAAIQRAFALFLCLRKISQITVDFCLKIVFNSMSVLIF